MFVKDYINFILELQQLCLCILYFFLHLDFDTRLHLDLQTVRPLMTSY